MVLGALCVRVHSGARRRHPTATASQGRVLAGTRIGRGSRCQGLIVLGLLFACSASACSLSAAHAVPRAEHFKRGVLPATLELRGGGGAGGPTVHAPVGQDEAQQSGTGRANRTDGSTAPRHTFSKVLSTVPLHRESARPLTFENSYEEQHGSSCATAHGRPSSAAHHTARCAQLPDRGVVPCIQQAQHQDQIDNNNDSYDNDNDDNAHGK